MFVNFNILNQLGSPAINSNTFANRPAAGQTGRLFVSTDTFEIYRDNGTGWDLIGGPGSSTVTGSGATGQVTYWTGTNTVSGENALFWDAAQNHLGINTATPTVALDVHSAADVALQLNGTGATPSIFQQFLSAGVSQYQVGYNWDASADYRRFSIYDSQGSKEVISIDQQSRFVGINYQYSSLTDQPAYTLDVSGSGRFTDSAYFATVAGNKVGIGTVNPDRILTVYSGTTDSRVLLQTQASGTGIASGFDLNIIYSAYGAYAQNDAQVWNYENAALVFATNNTERARFDNIGVFAINEISPYSGAKLVVKQASTYDGLYINNSTAINNSISFYHTGSIGAIETTYLSGGGSYTPITFWTNGLERVRVNTNGNTLIGTTTDAGQKLQVTGTAIVSSTMTAGSFIPSSSTIPTNGMYLSAANEISFATNSTQIINVNGSGNTGMGIGGTTPASRLHISGDFTQQTSLNIAQQFFIIARKSRGTVASPTTVLVNDEAGGILFSGYDGATWRSGAGIRAQIQAVSVGSLSSNLQFAAGNGSINGATIRMTMRGDTGNVLINQTTDTGEKLQVTGTVKTTDSITTGTPNGGTAGAWKFGSRVAAAVVLDTTQYIELDIGGTLYKLAIVT